MHGKKFQIFVHTVNRSTITLDITDKETIGNIKKQIQDKECIPIKQQSLRYKSKFLQSNMRVREYGIHTHCTLHLSLRTSPTIQKYIDDDILYSDDLFASPT
eukprot:189686_1